MLRRTLMAWMGLLTLWLAAGIAWAIVVCQSCGHEVRDGAEVCGHCGQAAPVPVAAAPAAPVDDVPAHSAAQTNAWVLDELIEAASALATGDTEVARCFLRNAAALEAALGSGGDVAKDIQNRLRALESRLISIAAPCPECGGTGRLVYRPQTLTGETIERSVAGLRCRRCAGAGTINRPASLAERRYAAGQGVKRYEARQRARGLTPLGGAWLPTELETGLTPERTARIKRAIAAPCETCGGFGRTDCATCKSQGSLPCSNRACQGGWVEQEVDGIGKTRQTRRVKCAVCGGGGRIACGSCAGKGSQVCAKCKGSGERELCAKCDGRGLSSCRRCDGQGAVKGVSCSACGATGRDLCKSCGGTGRDQ